jgi:hypothetical protein
MVLTCLVVDCIASTFVYLIANMSSINNPIIPPITHLLVPDVGHYFPMILQVSDIFYRVNL